MSQKSLFAFFKSPKAKKENTAAGGAAPDDDTENGASSCVEKTPRAPASNQKNSKRRTSPSSKENAKPKRRRVIISDDDDSSGDEYKPPSKQECEDSESDAMEVEEDLSDEEEIKSKAKPKKKTKTSSLKVTSASTPLSKFAANSPAVTPSTASSSFASPSVAKKTLNKLSSFSMPADTSTAGEFEGLYLHQTLDFLKPDKIRDAERRLRSDEGYDCRTLYIPAEAQKEFTPAMRQWWELKESHFDTVLFFKMGKFYEFFHMDADIGVKELGLVYMRGNYAHAGFPEIAYGRYADSLLRKGYKIARIEQTETPDMMNERLEHTTKKTTKFDKVVKREVCQVTTPGTRTPNFLDGETIDISSNYLLAVCDKPLEKGSRVGVCFVDTSIGKVHVGQFDDDIYGSRLRTLVAHYIPGQILHEKRSNSSLLAQLFKTTLASVMKEGLSPGKEFWDSEKTIKVLAESDYFSTEESSEVKWPDTVKHMLSDNDSIGRTCKDEYDLAMRSLGAVVWYLQFCYLDHDVLSLRSFSEYTPIDGAPPPSTTDSEDNKLLSFQRSRMVLDSVTLANLDILINQTTGTTEGSLIERLDNCKTGGGKRLLREWLSAPLCDHNLINDRLEAITNLMTLGDLSSVQNDLLKKLPDFERLLSRTNTLGHTKRNESHPDSRAIMFENETYSKRKIESFLSLLSGFHSALQVVEMFHSVEISSKLLKKCVSFKQDGGHMADVRPLLKFFEDAFDHEAAKKAGAIHPVKGYVEEYDESLEDIKRINADLTKNLESQKSLLSCSKIVYIGTGRNRYQMEVPDSACKKVPSHYEVTSQRKGFKRYITEHTKSLLGRMMEAEDKQTLALKETMRKIFNKFSENYTQWMDVVQCMNVLDVLVSLTVYTMTSEGVMCKPEIIPPKSDTKPFIEVRDGRHPSAIKTFGGGDFIPNDTVIGCPDTSDSADTNINSTAELLLLTGPNMGGKSTLMRQVGLLSILAQIGCYVPAEKCRLTPIDRMFTRLGASDRIMHGESTFFVELSETSIILKHATKHSLVLLDELGRGTATHDGTAIASAVVHELAENVQCRTIFSTHYHSLVDDFTTNQYVQLGHMACMVNEANGDMDNSAEGGETITFLYKLAPDFCPKSYGFNVARLAGLSEKIISLGLKKTQELERITESRRLIRSVMLADADARVTRLKQLVSAE